MKRTALIILAAILLPIISAQLFAQDKATARSTDAVKGADQPTESLSMNFSKIVPPEKEYVIFDAQGRQILDLKAGDSTSGVTDCAQIPCPESFDSDVVCWKCVERITSN
jgi:hypothetical protein